MPKESSKLVEEHNKAFKIQVSEAKRGSIPKQDIPSKPVRYISLSNLRFFLVLLVVCNHIGFSRFAPSAFEKHGIKIWFEFTSPILAILSGWLFFLNLSEEGFLAKIKNRYNSLIVPYMLWTCIYILIHALGKSVYFYFTGSTLWDSPVPSLTLNYILEAFWAKPVIVNFWYLKNLILIIPINWILFQLLRKPLFFEVFYLIVLCLMFSGVNLVFSDRFIQYYLIGCYLGSKQVGLGGVFFGKLTVMLGILAVGLLLEWFSRSVQYVFLINIPLILIIAIVLLGIFNNTGGNRLGKLLSKWQEHSFFVFCAHSIVLSIVGKLMVLVLPDTLFSNILTFSILVAFQLIFSVSVCVFLSSSAKRFNRRLWSVLIGERV